MFLRRDFKPELDPWLLSIMIGIGLIFVIAAPYIIDWIHIIFSIQPIVRPVLYLKKGIEGPATTIIILIVILAREQGIGQPERSQMCPPNPFITFLLVTLILWCIPIIFIILLSDKDIKRIVQIVVFFISAIFGIVYYLKNRVKFPTPADKITYFGIVLSLPVGLVEAFL